MSIINILVVHVVAWIRNFPITSCICILIPQLLVLFGKVIETLRGTVLLEEVCHWGRDLRFYSLILLLVYGWKCDQPNSCSCHQAFPDYLCIFQFMINSVPLEPWAKINTYVAFIRIFYHSHTKIEKTVDQCSCYQWARRDIFILLCGTCKDTKSSIGLVVLGLHVLKT